MTSRSTRTLTLYRDDSTVQVVYDRVKAVFWTAGNTRFQMPEDWRRSHPR